MLIARYAKIVMSLVLAAFCLLVAFDNITDYGTNYLFVQHVLSMDTTFPGNALMYRSITNPVLWQIAYALIIAAEGVTGILFLAGAIRLFQVRNATGAVFNEAKSLVDRRRARSPSSSGSSASWWWLESGSPCGSRRPGTARKLRSASIWRCSACSFSSACPTAISTADPKRLPSAAAPTRSKPSRAWKPIYGRVVRHRPRDSQAMAPPLLFLKDIRLTFGGTPLLDGAELSIGPFERLCLVGRNGSGKSTLLKIAAGMIEPDAGTRFVQPSVTIRYLPQSPDLSGFATTAAFVEAGLAPGDDPHRARYLLEKSRPHRARRTRRIFRAAKAGARRSPACWRLSPIFSCSTSPPTISMWSPSRAWKRCSRPRARPWF